MKWNFEYECGAFFVLTAMRKRVPACSFGPKGHGANCRVSGHIWFYLLAVAASC